MSAEEPAKKKLKTVYDFSKFLVENSHLEKLPNEILLKIVDYLQIGDLLRCGQTCRKIRSVVYDKSLWKKVNFSSNSKVPAGLLQLVLDHGCEFLNISNKLFGHLPLNQKSKLKFLMLDLSCYIDNIMYRPKIFDVLMSVCHSLEKLQLTNFELNSSLISNTCIQNSKTLKVLKLNLSLNHHLSMKLKVIQPIIDQCVELEELNFCQTRLSQGSIDYLVKNITPKISKLCLCTNLVKDKHIEVLVGRCTNLTELNLVATIITNDSLNYIIEKLQSTLEKLSLGGRLFKGEVHFSKLFELKAMKKLTVLNLHQVLTTDMDLKGKLESLRRQLHNVEIVHMPSFRVKHGCSDDISNFRCYE